MQTQTFVQPAQIALTNRFFFIYSLMQLAIVLVGFAPTLFLRSLSDAPPIPFYLHLHGAVLTGWFVLMMLQAWLIAQQNPRLHRKLGYFGAGYGVLVVCGGLMASLGVVPRALEEGITFESDIAELGVAGLGTGVSFLVFISNVVWVNVASVVAFALLLGSAVIFRRRADYHKRFILLATTSIVGPALARISRWPALGGEQGPFIPIVLLALLLALVVHDVYTLRKVHRATWAGILVIVLAGAAANGIGGSAAGQDFVRSLG